MCEIVVPTYNRNRKIRMEKPQMSEAVEVFRDYIAGVGRSDYQQVLPQLKAGTPLELTWERGNLYNRDPSNSYSYAIRVSYKGVKLGYVPAKNGANQTILQYRDGGAKVTAKLTAVDRNAVAYNMLCMAIEVSSPIPNAIPVPKKASETGTNDIPFSS